MANPPTVIVRFRVPGQTQVTQSNQVVARPGDLVVAETERGLHVGTVLKTLESPTDASDRILRTVNDDDKEVMQRHAHREREALSFCKERVDALGLSMKLVSVEIAHSGSTATFYFSSADRVDFRALVKDLAKRFHARIEMRQIGVRDASRHTGGLGACGRELCCSTWLPEFKPISLRMAKDQSLALNHDKLSGLCGRLKCCLQYEQETYENERKVLPKVGKRVVTPNGEGRVKDVNVLKRQVRVQLADGHYEEFNADEVTRIVGDAGLPAAAPAMVASAPEAKLESPTTEPQPEEAATKAESAATKRRRRRKKQKSGDGGS